jgi:hypothetical protein
LICSMGEMVTPPTMAQQTTELTDQHQDLAL